MVRAPAVDAACAAASPAGPAPTTATSQITSAEFNQPALRTIVRMTLPAARAPRRYDPERKIRIVDAAIDVVARNGVAGTTMRRIAAEADVPLGSLTYHFTGLDDLLAQAFERHAERMSPHCVAHFHAVRDREGFIDAVTDLIHG